MSTAVSVSTLVNLLQELVEDNFVEVLVRGELSNVSQPPSGHYYFTLKDKGAQLRCAMFRGHARMLRFKPQDGLAVICRGRVSIYPQRGDLQLIIESIEPEGVGHLQLAFDQLKEKLGAEGLFDQKLKQQLPSFPQSIGVVTSSTGAAFQDILNVLQRRSSGLRVMISPVRVQGQGAAEEIAAAISDLNKEGSSDVLIVGRGGGSREDLWAFNEENVARAIAASEIPIISAVGHEIDFSISDLVADLRAPTPSAAAELVVENRLDLERHLDQLSLRLAGQMRSHLLLLYSRLEGLENRLRAPGELLEKQQRQLDLQIMRMHQAMSTVLNQKNHHLNLLMGRLESLSPLAVLRRGYTIVKRDKSDEVIYQMSQLKAGDLLQLEFAEGQVAVTVTSIDKKGEK